MKSLKFILTRLREVNRALWKEMGEAYAKDATTN